jgi:hypothetical protein
LVVAKAWEPIARTSSRVRCRLAYVRQQEQQLASLRSFRREMAARTCVRLRRETRLQLHAMRQLLHALFA